MLLVFPPFMGSIGAEKGSSRLTQVSSTIRGAWWEEKGGISVETVPVGEAVDEEEEGSNRFEQVERVSYGTKQGREKWTPAGEAGRENVRNRLVVKSDDVGLARLRSNTRVEVVITSSCRTGSSRLRLHLMSQSPSRVSSRVSSLAFQLFGAHPSHPSHHGGDFICYRQGNELSSGGLCRRGASKGIQPALQQI